jgi:hypothetical protein
MYGYSFELREHLLNDQWPASVPGGAAVFSLFRTVANRVADVRIKINLSPADTAERVTI